MEKGEFITVSKRMVREYFNRYVKEVGARNIVLNDVRVIDFRDRTDNYKVLLTTWTSDLYFGVTYYKDTNKIRSYMYKKVGTRFYGKNFRRKVQRKESK